MKNKRLLIGLLATLSLSACSSLLPSFKKSSADTLSVDYSQFMSMLDDDSFTHDEHVASNRWSYDGEHHWKECVYGDGYRLMEDNHQMEESFVDSPTYQEEGFRRMKCSVCGYEEVETLPVYEHDATMSVTNTSLDKINDDVYLILDVKVVDATKPYNDYVFYFGLASYSNKSPTYSDLNFVVGHYYPLESDAIPVSNVRNVSADGRRFEFTHEFKYQVKSFLKNQIKIYISYILVPHINHLSVITPH